ncbi:MAG: membrane protein insertion efficiency factor YidD [Alphaproteobacteria bacterium]|nr:membrane protein insertion efficiency factor YidD [Alphaproteobacteria bacterium]
MRAFGRDLNSSEYLGADWKYTAAQTPPHRCASRALVAAIELYQAYLSPLKGFSCAHRTLHNGPSCSQFVKQAIAAGGCTAGWTALKLRATECREALAVFTVRRTHRIEREQGRNQVRSAKRVPGEEFLPQIVFASRRGRMHCRVLHPAVQLLVHNSPLQSRLGPP